MDTCAGRLQRLPRTRILGLEVAVASDYRARLLGLAFLDREQVGEGLLIPRCSSVHTFGMRFELSVVFLDAGGVPLATRDAMPVRRIVSHRGAAAVLERPAQMR